MYSARARGSDYNAKESGFRLDIRKKIFMVRVVRPWQRLLSENAYVPSLEMLKARLNGALCILIWWVATLPVVWTWDWISFKVFQPKISYYT